MVELLSPAGNLEKLKFAIEYGADAVYTALKSFSLRSRAPNLSFDEYLKAIDFVKSRSKRLYLTLNSYIFDRELNELKGLLDFLNKYPPDAVIVSDLGVLSMVNKYTNIPVHISTQANITNSEAINLLKQFRVERVVLARELTIGDIKVFKKNSDVELEAFVHGAMCMSYSGRCFISAYLTGRSANRGDCVQSCRWNYSVVESKRPDEVFEIEEHPEGSFIFNSYDMCALPILDKLIDAGISSFKIEGRMKSLYYVAITTAIYRDAIDTILNGGDFKSKIPFYMEELKKVSHRPYSFGFYLGHPKQYLKSSGYIRKCRFSGVVLGKKGDLYIVGVRDKMETGRYEVFSRGLKIKNICIDVFEESDGSKKKYGNPNEILYIRLPEDLEELSLLRRCDENNSR
ncbi:U32 family peptidase [Hippea maritima]|uniref:Peptidase U32 n=1 Tax=Hippea maritima (strain ATCC 700847 / DSM 10411 / MH2) TaxID=760142 RepID=F2LW60_HIPMA|nr:U32 family peptidase [Hippea maritima]AEA33994.1 peptidase U32 [Hippea maritima DSM 10411]